MYAFMERMPNTRYSDNNVQFQIAYGSQVPRGHEFLAAAWMYRMTEDPKYVATAQAVHAQAGALYHNPVLGWANPLQVRGCARWCGCVRGGWSQRRGVSAECDSLDATNGGGGWYAVRQCRSAH